MFFPPARVRASRFYYRLSPLLFSSFPLPPPTLQPRAPRRSVGTAGPQPRVPDLSGHCWTSTTSASSQWALPGLNRECQISVGTAGPQPRAPAAGPQLRAPDLRGHCQTSTASSRSQRALPDLNRELQSSVGTAGPQPRPQKMSNRMPKRMPE